MLRSLVLVVLLCITSVSPFVVPNCPNDTVLQQVGSLAYSSGNTVCPHFTNIPGSQWRYNDIGSPVTSPINYSADQVCLFNGTVLVVNPERFANQSNGNLTFFDSSGGNVTFLFAAIGIYRYLTPSNIILTEGNSSRIQFLIYTVAPSVNYLFYRVNQDGTETLLFNSSSASSIRVPPFTFSPFGRSPCQETDESGSVRPQLLDIRVNDISVSDSGQYRTGVLINNMRLSTDVNITVVLPLESSPTASPTSVMSFTLSSPSPSPSLSPSLPITTSTVTASSTPTEPSGPTQRATLIVIIVVVVLGVIAVTLVLVAIILIVCCCIWIKRNSNKLPIDATSLDNVELKSGYGDGKGETDGGTINKADSPSSRQPLILPQRRSSHGQATPKQDFTAVYCSQRYTQIWSTMKDRHGDLIEWVENDDEICKVLLDSSCVDIHIYADPDDEVLKVMMSRGISANREKLKWWHFVSKDKTPENTIGAEGYKIVQVERDDDHLLMTLQVGLLKAEKPLLNQRNGDVHVIHETLQGKGGDGSYSTAAATSTPVGGTRHEHVESSDTYPELIKAQIEALKENTEVQRQHLKEKQKGIEVQKEQLEVQKKGVHLQDKTLKVTLESTQLQRERLALEEASLVQDQLHV